jgi:hypothetical protein
MKQNSKEQALVRMGNSYFRRNERATTALFDQVSLGKEPNPELFYEKDIFVWDLSVSHPNCKITCPYCLDNGDKIKLKGFLDSPRMVYDENDRIFVFIRRYFCTTCNRKLNSSSASFISHLPLQVLDN